MAAWEGYQLRVQKTLDANFRQLGWLIMNSFADPKKIPKSPQSWWHLDIDDICKPDRINGGRKLTPEQLKRFLMKMN
ncbi:hypothetical protein [Arachidicoccus rhizosphaerae]|nr:hypothetical protein [Arachidicoccus rhizosphaerae]